MGQFATDWRNLPDENGKRVLDDTRFQSSTRSFRAEGKQTSYRTLLRADYCEKLSD